MTKKLLLGLTKEEQIILAKDRNTSPETLSELSEIDNEDIQAQVAANTNTTPEALAELAEHKYIEVRQLAKRNLRQRKN